MNILTALQKGKNVTTQQGHSVHLICVLPGSAPSPIVVGITRKVRQANGHEEEVVHMENYDLQGRYWGPGGNEMNLRINSFSN
jgi:hypothetical protein